MIRRVFGAASAKSGSVRTSAPTPRPWCALRRYGNRLHRFIDHVERAREADRSGDLPVAERALDAAAALHTGALLAQRRGGLAWIAAAARAVEEMARDRAPAGRSALAVLEREDVAGRSSRARQKPPPISTTPAAPAHDAAVRPPHAGLAADDAPVGIDEDQVDRARIPSVCTARVPRTTGLRRARPLRATAGRCSAPQSPAQSEPGRRAPRRSFDCAAAPRSARQNGKGIAIAAAR